MIVRLSLNYSATLACFEISKKISNKNKKLIEHNVYYNILGGF